MAHKEVLKALGVMRVLSDDERTLVNKLLRDEAPDEGDESKPKRRKKRKARQALGSGVDSAAEPEPEPEPA